MTAPRDGGAAPPPGGRRTACCRVGRALTLGALLSFAWLAAGCAPGRVPGVGSAPATSPAAPATPAGTAEAKPPRPAVPVPSWGKPLPYPVVIADRHNNRLIEVTPDKRVVWEFDSPDEKVYRGNDDVFFAPDGASLMVSEEDNYDIHQVDYEKRQLVWTFGVPDVKGSKPGYLNYPDDAHLLPNGQVLVADIRNCRILFIDRATNQIVKEWGKPGQCRHDPPHALASPNGATPLPGGDILVTEIGGSWISRLTQDGKVVWSVQAPGVSYPSDAFLTADGQVIVADYADPGQVVIFDPRTRRVSWRYRVTTGEGRLANPSLARELPTGDIILNDDRRHRVVVIDRQTKKIIWQYGVTDKPGKAPGYLNYPDGLDLDVYHDWRLASQPQQEGGGAAPGR